MYTTLTKGSVVVATLLALAACGDDTGTSSGGGNGGSSGDGGNSSQGGNASTPSSSGASPTTTGGTTSASTGEGPGPGPGPGSGGEGPGPGPGSGGEGPGSGGEGPGNGGAGPGSGGDGPGSGGEGPGTGAGGPGSGGEGPGSGTGGAPPACGLVGFFIEPCDTCAVTECCDELEACDANGTCQDPDTGEIDADLVECLFDECAPECVGGVCDTGLNYPDPNTDACVDPACCDEFTQCYGDGTNQAQITACNDCVNEGSGALCNGLLACLDQENCFPTPLCAAGEFTCADGSCQPLGFVCDQVEDCAGGEDESSCAGVCDSNIQFNFQGTQNVNPTLNACLGNACCAEFNVCTDDGADPDACITCLNNGSGALCNGALACEESSGCFAGICDANLTYQDPYLDACFAGNCCEAFSFCTGDHSDADVGDCLDCLDAGGGALCDDAITCAAVSCNVDITQ